MFKPKRKETGAERTSVNNYDYLTTCSFISLIYIVYVPEKINHKLFLIIPPQILFVEGMLLSRRSSVRASVCNLLIP